MPLPVSLDDVASELEALSDDSVVYVNRRTGEVANVSTEDLSALEESGGDSEEFRWLDTYLAALRSILETDEWAEMPRKYDIHEWEIMREFADGQRGGLRDDLLTAIRGRGAFRMFKDTLHRRGMLDAWFDFKHGALARIAAEALDAEAIPYRESTRKLGASPAPPARASNPFTGRWRIVIADGWPESELDFLGEAFIEFAEEGKTGSFQLVAFSGEIDHRLVEREEGYAIEWSWEGTNDDDTACGRGVATIDGDALHGRLFIHRGDDSAFVAVRKTKTKKRARR